MAIRFNFDRFKQSTRDLRFLKELDEYAETKPYYISGSLSTSANIPHTNIQYQMVQHVPLVNLRGQENLLSVDKHGFEIMPVPKDIVGLDIKDIDKDKYIRRMAAALKDHLDASFVLCYDYRFRSSDAIQRDLSHDTLVGTSKLPDSPAEVAHIDHTPVGARRRARRHLTEAEAENYLGGPWRMRILNIWKPLKVVQDFDLLYCDFSSIQPDDIVAVDRVSSEYAGEVYMLRPREHYEWYWIDNQRPDEASLFVSYDSAPNLGGAAYCPHASGKNLDALPTAPPRESIELRMLVFSRPT